MEGAEIFLIIGSDVLSRNAKRVRDFFDNATKLLNTKVLKCSIFPTRV